MADFNGDSPTPSSSIELQRTAMEALNEDLILEIIARLPLRYAIQCSLLNKSLRRSISQPGFRRRVAALSSRAIFFHCSAQSPKILTLYCHEIRSDHTSSSLIPASVTLKMATSIIASCNGLLLLRIQPGSKHFVFNPITRGITAFDYPIDCSSIAALAVDLDNSPFKLVTAEAERESERTVVRFSVVVPSSNGSMVLKSRSEFLSRRRFTLTAEDGFRPVYAAGSMYWLGDKARVTVAFDVERRRPRIIDGPVINERRTGDKWFGFAGGSIRFVHSLREEIVICGLDRLKGEWRVDRRVANISNRSNNDHKYGQCVHCDGGRLFFLVRKIEGEGHVYVYDLLRETWTKRWRLNGLPDCEQRFLPFTPTTAKACDFYEKEEEKKEEEEEEVKDTFIRLRLFMKPTANYAEDKRRRKRSFCMQVFTSRVLREMLLHLVFAIIECMIKVESYSQNTIYKYSFFNNIILWGVIYILFYVDSDQIGSVFLDAKNAKNVTKFYLCGFNLVYERSTSSDPVTK